MPPVAITVLNYDTLSSLKGKNVKFKENAHNYTLFYKNIRLKFAQYSTL